LIRGTDPAEKHRHLRPSGGYRKLRSFHTATVVYDATVQFCRRFVDSRSRTKDQMIQAARSGRQNIAEGSRAAATSSQTELRLVNVARASLDELLLDFEDFLRQNGHVQWAKESPESIAVRAVGQRLIAMSDQSDPTAEYRQWLASNDPAIVANAIICLIHQANYLLDRQIQSLEHQFIEHGGYSELLAAARDRERRLGAGARQTGHQSQPDQQNSPSCPVCGSPMVLRRATKGAGVGSQFWGCGEFPRCAGTRPIRTPLSPNNH
jgi:restriction system protein